MIYRGKARNGIGAPPRAGRAYQGMTRNHPTVWLRRARRRVDGLLGELCVVWGLAAMLYLAGR